MLPTHKVVPTMTTAFNLQHIYIKGLIICMAILLF